MFRHRELKPFFMQILPKIFRERFQSRGWHLGKFIATKESVCIRKEFNSHRIGLGHQHGAVTSSENALLFSPPIRSFCHANASLRFAIQETKTDQKRQDTSRGISPEINSKVKITTTSTLTKQRSIQTFSYSQLPWRRRAFMMWCSFAPPIRRWLRSSFDARFAIQQRKDDEQIQDKTRRIYTESQRQL